MAPGQGVLTRASLMKGFLVSPVPKAACHPPFKDAHLEPFPERGEGRGGDSEKKIEGGEAGARAELPQG